MDTRTKEYWMREFPGIHPLRAELYAACVQPFISLRRLFPEDAEGFDYDSELGSDWRPDFLKWVDVLGTLQAAQKIEAAEARIAELESAVSAVNRWWKFAQENTHRNREERMRLLDAALEKCEAAHAMPQEEKGAELEEMLEATPDRLQRILQGALHEEYMRPCDERP